MKIKLLVLFCIFACVCVEKSVAMTDIRSIDEQSMAAAETLVKFSSETSPSIDSEKDISERKTKNQLHPKYDKEKIIKTTIKQLFCASKQNDPLALKLSTEYKKDEIKELLIKNLPDKLNLSSRDYIQLQKNSQAKFSTSIRKSLLLSQKKSKLRKNIANLQKYRNISENNIKEIQNEKIASYDEINMILSDLEYYQHKLFESDDREMSERRSIMNILEKLEVEKEKLHKILTTPNSPSLSQEKSKFVNNIINLQQRLGNSEDNLRKILNKKITLSDEMKMIRFDLEHYRNKLLRLDVREMLERNSIMNTSAKLEAKVDKLNKISSISKKIRRENCDDFILSNLYKNMEELLKINN